MILLKADHDLPVAGSVKARGGIYNVLYFAEALCLKHGLDGRTRKSGTGHRPAFPRQRRTRPAVRRSFAGGGADKSHQTYQAYNTHESSDQSDQADMPDVEYSLVRDPGLLKQLDAEENRGEYLTLYRAAQLVDGKLYPPMAAKINGEWPAPIRLEKWEQADEHPELIVKGNKFKLDKGNGSSITAAYNPYIHSSETPLNDQFSSAWKRPELLMKEFHFRNFIVGFIKQIVRSRFKCSKQS